jgi:hypothetical protein
MSQENVEVAYRAIGAFNRRDSVPSWLSLAQMLYGRRTLSFRDFGLGSVLARGGQDRKA